MNKESNIKLINDTIESCKAFRRFVFLVIFLSILIITGCKIRKEIVKETVHDSVYVTETQRDTIFTVWGDSAIYQFNFECDSLNQVLLTEIKELKSGEKIITKYKYIPGKLVIRTIVPTEQLKAALKDRIIKYFSEHVRIIKEETPKFWTRWWFFLILGALGMLIFIKFVK